MPKGVYPGEYRPRGIHHHNAKLSDHKARFILRSSLPHTELARMFSVSARAIWQLRRRITWTHVEGE